MASPRLFAPDPIDLADPSPYTALPYYAHIVIGLLAFVAIGVALWARKGSSLHIGAGKVYLLSLIVVGFSSAAMLAVAFVPPLMLAAVAGLYAAISSWLALQKSRQWVVVAEAGLAIAQVAALVVFLSFAIPAIRGGAVPAPAIAVLCVIPALLLLGDIRYFLRYKEREKLRLGRHLSRMIWAVVVTIRAPLVEVVAAGLPFPQPLLVVGPIILGFGLIWYFSRKYRVPAAFVI
ncbi:hypothetical protein GCM10010923_12310 [Blastomonas marina]|uniref:DUF2306 domain-containing protein n=1 Tax=Blastomonas marina TaxID=1867408 RepID=A0ABQ1FBB8_9SPHN|nr:hypothetical protein [Blastomonas marina]GGA04497.1 hypothetical protein GCM10010923_12310 [Blastomonas marina]